MQKDLQTVPPTRTSGGILDAHVSKGSIRSMKAFSLAVLGALVGAAILTMALLQVCARLDLVEGAYPSFQDAVHDGAVGEGRWIPEFLPPSAVDIRVVRNLDLNTIWLTFRMNPTDITSMQKRCSRVQRQNVVFVRGRPRHWWPKELLAPGPERQQGAGRYHYYECDEGGTLAVDANASEVYFWQFGSDGR